MKRVWDIIALATIATNIFRCWMYLKPRDLITTLDENPFDNKHYQTGSFFVFFFASVSSKVHAEVERSSIVFSLC